MASLRAEPRVFVMYTEWCGSITSHVFLTLEHHKCVATMWLLLLVGLFIGMRIRYNANLEGSTS